MEERLEIADKVKAEGDIATAATLYLRLARAKPETETVKTARERFIGIREESEAELAKVDAMLDTRNDKSAGAAKEFYSKTISKSFDAYQDLLVKYGRVSGVGTKLHNHIRKQKRTPEYAAVLNEPEARELFQMARMFELKGQACCAYHVYDEARKLRHAPSAKLAAERFAILQADPTVVADAKRCADIQWCQSTFLKASSVAGLQPGVANRLFESILTRAPKDSQVYVDTAKRLGVQ